MNVVVVEDYPKTLAELETRFSSEQACREYLFGLLAGGFPLCALRRKQGLAAALRALAMRCLRVSAFDNGGNHLSGHAHSADDLVPRHLVDDLPEERDQRVGPPPQRRVPGLGSYQTAWTCLHKLCYAMVRPGRERLSGTVEVDETWLGGLESGVHGRQTQSKVLIVVAAEEDGAGTGRIRLQSIPDASSHSLLGFIQQSVEAGELIHTDGWPGYFPLAANG